MRYITWALIGLGIGTRLAQYLYNRPFWGDELALIDNLVHRSFAGLALPLDNAQAAPVPFLWLEKLSVMLLGTSTYALRLVPLLAGIAAFFLFWRLVKRVAPSATVVALILFATSNWLIYYASETKQYSLDVVVALLLFLLYVRKTPPFWLMVGGAIAVWCSHPAIFVLAGIGLAWLLAGPRLQALAAGAVWLLSFGLAYLALYSSTAGNEVLLNYWLVIEPSFIRLELFSIFKAFMDTGMLLSGLYQPVFLVIVLVGLIIALRLLTLEQACLFLAPLLLAAGASMLERYPYNGRFLLFALPGLMVVVAIGLTDIFSRLSSERRLVFASLVTALLVVALTAVDVTQNGLFR